MRIIGGRWGRRRLHTPNNLKLRPTTDQAKEALFNILNTRLYFQDLEVLDLFAGTGSIGFEFASRGAVSLTAVENNPIHFRFIQSVKELLDIRNMQILRSDVFKFLERNLRPYDLIFADPPYDLEALEQLPNLVLQSSHLKAEGLFILEHSAKHNFETQAHFVECRKYGKVHFSFFEMKEQIS